MYALAVISRKGGTGKTTLALHLAVAAMLYGFKTVVIDLDPQASASKWFDIRGEDDLTVVSAHATRLKQILYTAETPWCGVRYNRHRCKDWGRCGGCGGSC